MLSTGADQRAYQMTMSKGDPGFTTSPRRTLFAERGTELKISPLLEGIRTLSGEKIQWYLASELRDRIRNAGVRVTVVDKLARKQYEVEPRQFEGRLLHQLPAVRTPFGDAYAEIYLAEPSDAAQVALTRSGTRVIEDLRTLPGLEHEPWTSGHLQGLVDAPFLNLTPGTRSGIIHDDRFAALLDALAPLEAALSEVIAAQRRAEEEQASQQALKAIQKAFHEAILALPPEEYDWFEIKARTRHGGPSGTGAEGTGGGADGAEPGVGIAEPTAAASAQRQFFEFAGPLFAVVVSPAASTTPLNESRKFRALPRDRSRRRVTEDLAFAWEIAEGGGSLTGVTDQEVEFCAPSTPGLTRLRATVTQRDVTCTAEALITVTDRLDVQGGGPATVSMRGLPGYTFERAAGELWRSRFDTERNLIIVNSGHRDFVFATRSRALQLRYLVRLYVKELVLRNFAGAPAEQLLERMIELSLYAEEKLKPGA